MKINKLFILLIAFIPISAYSQSTVLWASELVDYSSEYGKDDYSAAQALGVPNAMGGSDQNQFAWVPKRETNTLGEFIHVKFAKSIRVSQVAVAESLNPGAIFRIFFIDSNGKEHKVFENKNPKPILARFRLFRHTFQKTNYLVQEVRIELKTKSVPGSNQIDAIAISDSGVPIKMVVESLTYSDLAIPEKLSANVNSEFAERLPIISPDGKTLYFARKYHPQNMGNQDHDDIWISKLNATGDWGFATNPGPPLNNRENNFALSFNPTGNTLYLGNDYEFGAANGVSVSFRKGRGWSDPKTFEIDDHYNLSKFVSYHVSIDGQILLMAVERKEGFGDRDLYVSFRKGEMNWTKPKNFGPTINTAGMESSIFLAADNKTIYFSSNGHKGYGGLDMFYSKRLDDSWTNWSEPKNLGEGINTPNNEYNYSIPASGEYAYFSSDDSKGMSDIYRVRLPKILQPHPVVLYSGKVLDAETLQPIAASKIKLQNLKKRKENASLVANGNYQFTIPFGEDVQVHAELEGYFALSQSLELSGEILEGLDFDEMSESSYTVNETKLQYIQSQIDKLNQEIDRLEEQRLKSRAKVKVQSDVVNSSKSDRELDQLKEKYNGGSKRKKQESGQNSGDEELDNLKSKFGKAFEEEDSEVVMNDEEREKSDKDLSKLKDRYSKYFNQNETIAEKDEGFEVDENETKENIEFYKEKVREELEAKLLPTVIADLEYRLVSLTVKNTINELSDEEKVIAQDYQTKTLLKERLKNNPFPIDYPKPVKANVRGLDPQLKKSIVNQITEEVNISLEDKWKEEVRDYIKQEFLFLVKSEAEQALVMQLQVEMEKKEKVEPIQKIKNITPEVKPIVVKYREETVDLMMVPIKEGQTIPMNNVFFDANKSILKSISLIELQRVLYFLKNHPKMVIEIGGHTNGWCSHEFANQLSKERTQSVKDYLVEEGIDSDRIMTRGYGKTKPLATDDTAQGRKKNQRVEMKILSLGS